MSLSQKFANVTATASGRQAMMVPVSRPIASTSRSPALLRKLAKSSEARQNIGRYVCCAVTETQEASTSEAAQENWVPVCLPEELPKGVRKEVDVDGRQVLLFWYRNQIYAIQGRSPAEGAYSEGFIKAKFTQDFAIECPSTGSLFSLKDGSVMSWYPNNPVLRALTPPETIKKMEIYPVKLTQQAIMVDVSSSAAVAPLEGRGGAGTSLENNNIFTVQPVVYFEGMDPTQESASLYQTPTDTTADKPNPAVAALATGALGAVAVAGTAVFLYLENPYALGAFWVVLGGAVAYVGYKYVTRAQQ